MTRTEAEVVRRQAEIGIDVLNDGEYGKVSYSGYVKERLSGFNGEPRRRNLADDEFPDWERPFRPQVRYPTNDAPVELVASEPMIDSCTKASPALSLPLA